MTSSKPFVLGLALALGAASPERVALAQIHTPTASELETARTLYKQGKELRTRGDLRGALEKLRAAHALGNTPVTGVELARTYVLLGLFVEARETCFSMARMPVASDETEKSVEARADAEKLAEELRPRIPTLLVKVDGLEVGETSRVWIDDVPVPYAATTEAQKVNPGSHEVIVRAGEGPRVREVRGNAEVAEGETREVALTLPAPVPSGAREPPTPETLRVARRSVLPFANVGLAVAIGGAGVGLVTGLVAMTKASQLGTECPNNTCSGDVAVNDLQSAKTMAGISTVSFAVAGVGALVGLVFFAIGASDASPKRGTDRPPVTGFHAAFDRAGIHGCF